MDLFYRDLGPENSAHIRLAVMDMWKAFRNSANRNAPSAAILFDKFHVLRHLGEALDKVRKQEYARVTDSRRHSDFTSEKRHRSLQIEGLIERT